MNVFPWACCWIALAVGCGASPTGGDRQPLRVGTTGEYPPFSLATDNGYVGIDIDLARDLGRELGRTVVFVETTWPTLVRDAIDHRFDLAMSAINVTEERALAVDFSRPYHQYGRVAIVRCTDRDRYRTYEEINHPDVLIFVREGGTTAAFAHRTFPEARVQQTNVHLAYQRVVDGEGDVIVATDYEHRRNFPELCVALGGAPFFVTPVAVMFPKGSPLVGAVDAWLETRITDGTVRRLLDHYSAR